MPKRYVLMAAGGPISKTEMRSLKATLEGKHKGMKVIELKDNPMAVIIKTDETTARAIRSGTALGDGGLILTPTLTSGAIGKLKKRAVEARANDKIHE